MREKFHGRQLEGSLLSAAPPRLGFVIWQKQEHFRQAMLWVWQECRLFLGNTGIRVAEFQRPDGW